MREGQTTVTLIYATYQPTKKKNPPFFHQIVIYQTTDVGCLKCQGDQDHMNLLKIQPPTSC